jgi:hypothetical protein
VKLTVFQAGKGDCLLLTGRDGTNILIDGGMRDDYRRHVAGALGRLAEADERLDLVYLSHIDQDHISGVLQLLDDVVAWRVFDFQRSRNNTRFPQPERPRPPVIANVWHNGFRDQVADNSGEIEDLLAVRASILAASNDPGLQELAPIDGELATSIREGLELSQRVGPEQLGIPLNKQFKGRLALVRDGQQPIRFGGMTVSVIGPFRRDLDALRRDWNEWLETHREQLSSLRRRMARDAARLTGTETAALSEPLALAARELGDRSRVTVPNLASLMLHVEEKGHTILLTGDGHAADILKGLEKTKKLDRDGRIHVDVLKVQHHGSEHNIDAAFLGRVSADTYVHCANGEHENPDLRVVQAVVDSRLAPEAAAGGDPRGGAPFALLFNSSSRAAPGTRERDHMRKVERLVKEAGRRSGGRLSHTFLDDSSFTLEIG